MILTKEKDNQKQVQSRCPMCQKVNDLDSRYSHTELEVGDRKRFLVKQKLCFGCYKPISKDHNGRNCMRIRICCDAMKIIQQDCMDTSQRTKNQWQEAVKTVKKNQLAVEEKLHVHQQPSKKMSSVCVWCQLG